MFWDARPYRQPMIALTHIVDLLEAFALPALIYGSWLSMKGHAVTSWKQSVFRAALALFIASGVKEALKIAFGRTWPETWTNNNPSFIRDGVFGFSPFHGGAGWASFPSGHETIVCAVAACLWSFGRASGRFMLASPCCAASPSSSPIIIGSAMSWPEPSSAR